LWDAEFTFIRYFDVNILNRNYQKSYGGKFMKKTIIITGSSSGIGKATALYFSQKGWNVAATMRKPEDEKDIKESSSMKLYRLDVQDEDSIKKTIEKVISDFGKIDVVLNNAGYGAKGPFEAASKGQIKRQFDVNVFGLMAVIQHILPHFRQNNSGAIINVSSIGGRLTIPLYSLYHGTKWAVEGFSESLAYELAQFGIKVKIIEPGTIKTDFTGRSEDTLKKEGLDSYESFIKNCDEQFAKFINKAADPKLVAQTIYKAATDTSKRLRYIVGKDAKMFWTIRRYLGDGLAIKVGKKVLGLQ
jgi:NAD(P)-dependent dehydrogenase (short-subunit alcohol dehydrogenase family)